METATPQLVARDLFQSFRMGPRRIEVLRGISMEVARNEAVFLSGASGAGKTTLLYTLAGLERPESGTVPSLAMAAILVRGRQSARNRPVRPWAEGPVSRAVPEKCGAQR